MRPSLPRFLSAVVLLFLASACGRDGPPPTGPEGAVLQQGNGVRLLVVSGGGQSGAPGTALPLPVMVRVLDARDQPVAGATLNFLTPDGGSAKPRQVRTDATGHAQGRWTLGAAPGEQVLRVSGTGGTLTVVANGVVAASLRKVSGDGQLGPAGSPLALPLVVQALRADGTPAAGIVIHWKAGGGGSLSTASSRTGDDGTASVQLTMGNASGQTVTASSARVPSMIFRARLGAGPAPVATVRVSPDSLQLRPGGTGALTATAYDAQGNVLTGRPVEWASSAVGVAAVAGGVVTGVAEGSARVTATVQGVSGSASVRVVSPPPPPPPPGVASVRVTPDSLALTVGGTHVLVATAYDAEGSVLTGRPVVWTSTAADVAAVASGGVVTGQAEGSARITATVEGISGSASVRVGSASPPPPPPGIVSLRVEPSSLSLAVGGSASLRAVATDARGNVVTGRRVLWASLSAGTARVDSGGRVTGVSAGSTRIRATVDGLMAYADVTVQAASPPAGEGPWIGGIQINRGPNPLRPRDRVLVQIFSIADPDGVTGGTVTARGPDGLQTATCSLTLTYWSAPPYPGPPNSPWHCYLDIPEDAQHGTWTLDPVTATDSRGHRTVRTGAQLLAERPASSVQFPVENLAYDKVAPTITGTTITLTRTEYGHRLDVRVSAADVGSGVSRVGIQATSTGGPLDRINSCWASGPGTYDCMVWIPTGEASGEILIAPGVADRAENYRGYTTAQLEALGFQGRIAVP